MSGGQRTSSLFRKDERQTGSGVDEHVGQLGIARFLSLKVGPLHDTLKPVWRRATHGLGRTLLQNVAGRFSLKHPIQ